MQRFRNNSEQVITWYSLNRDILKMIALWLPYRTLLAFARVCKCTAIIIRANKFWHEKACHQFMINDTSFRSVYELNDQLRYLYLYERQIPTHITDEREFIYKRRRDRFLKYGPILPVWHDLNVIMAEYTPIPRSKLLYQDYRFVYRFILANGNVQTVEIPSFSTGYVLDLLRDISPLRLNDFLNIMKDIEPDFDIPTVIREGDILSGPYYIYYVYDDNSTLTLAKIARPIIHTLPVEMMHTFKCYHIRTELDFCYLYGIMHHSRTSNIMEPYHNTIRMDNSSPELRLAENEQEYSDHIDDPIYYHDE